MTINARILHYLNEKRISISSLSAPTGIAQPNLYRLLHSDELKLSQLEKITNALGLPITYFFGESNSTDIAEDLKISENRKRIALEHSKMTLTSSLKLFKGLKQIYSDNKETIDLYNEKYTKKLIEEDYKRDYNQIVEINKIYIQNNLPTLPLPDKSNYSMSISSSIEFIINSIDNSIAIINQTLENDF